MTPLGCSIIIAIDAAATEMYDEAKKIGKDGYYFWKTDIFMTRDEIVAFWEDLAAKYPIISLEDGVAEEDWDAWKLLCRALSLILRH